MSMTSAFECWSAFLAEQRSEPDIRYGEMSSTSKNAEPAPKALSGERLSQLAGKGGA